jgi:hypothetical protein
MNTNNFKILVEALESFSTEDRDCKEQEIIAAERLKDGRITRDMMNDISVHMPEVLDIALDYIPELKALYTERVDYCCNPLLGFDCNNDNCIWVSTLNAFLECDFVQWVKDFTGIWDNDKGYLMYCSNEAFGKSDHNELVTIDDIIIHIRKAYDRLARAIKK